MNSPILPAFPPELEREIFEMAAIDIPQSMPQLVRVARRVCVWIEPLLYRTLIVTAPWSDALRLAIEIHPAKSAKYLRDFLAWGYYSDKEWPLRILSLCSGIRNLTLFYANSAMVTALEVMELRRLSVVLLDLIDEYAKDWKVGVEGGRDFWVRAELFVAKRKHGEIQPASRYWIQDTDFND
ncbi:hypothetical protein C8J57DRAFT_288477 [Mycena rebaudengoi]|nr:hypothetical protein C8J57DRAFT_288477 [Mycena rebaudengoi]